MISETELQQILSRPAIAARNPTGGQASGAVPKRRRQNAPNADRPVKARHPRKCLVCITCFRAKHRQDPDNGVYKWHIDAIRRANLLDDDSADAIQLVICPEVKVATVAEERTEIYIEIIEPFTYGGKKIIAEELI